MPLIRPPCDSYPDDSGHIHCPACALLGTSTAYNSEPRGGVAVYDRSVCQVSPASALPMGWP